MSPKDITKACEILRSYEGDNDNILSMKKQYSEDKLKLTEFNVQYITKNYRYKRIHLNRIVLISSDFGETLMKKYDIDFLPEKLYITDIIGEMGNSYHCYVQYRRSVPPTLMYLNKKHMLTQLDVSDYLEMEVDFDKYDKKTQKLGRKLREHQKTAIKFLLTNKKCILADSQGLGKTTSAIVAALEGGFSKTLIITTKSVKSTWRREIEIYEKPSNIEIISGSRWTGAKKFTIINYDIIKNFYEVPMEQEYSVESHVGSDGEVKTESTPIMVRNPNNKKLVPKMRVSTKKAVIEDSMSRSPIFKEHFDCVIIDEAQKLSNNTSIRYKTISDFLKKTKPEAVFLLTGTPLTNRPMNLYHVLRLINADIAKDYNYYCSRYCDGKKVMLKSGKEVMLNRGASHLNELREKIKHLYIRRLQSEIPGMVEKNVITRYYDLDDAQKERYDSLWSDYVNAQEGIGNYDSEKYRQLVEGTIVRQYLANEMAQNTIELVDSQVDYGEKVIIVCTFQEEMDKFKKYYGKKAVVFDGKMSAKQKDKAVDEFMNNPDILVFIGQIIACGVGLTLTSSKYLVFNSYSWVAADNLQVQDRIYRLTQTRDVTCVYQLFTDSISQDMFEKVMRKELIMNETIKSENEKQNI